jgi:phytanoyl-CoA hydroxylase
VAMSMPDLDTHAAQLRDEGFTILRGVAKTYIEAIGHDIDFLRSRAVAARDDGASCPSGWFGGDGSLWSADRQTLVQLQITYRTSAAMLALACTKQVLDVVAGVLGDNIELFGEGQSFTKPPRSTARKHWHQDDAFFEHAGEGQVAALMYAQDTSAESGALRVIPGSHLSGTFAHGDSTSHLSAAASADSDVIVEGAAGDVVLFHGRLLHGSSENRSAEWRNVVVNRYRHAGDYVTRTGTTTDTMHLVQVPFARGGSGAGQEGLLVRGVRPFEQASGWAWPIWQQHLFGV